MTTQIQTRAGEDFIISAIIGNPGAPRPRLTEEQRLALYAAGWQPSGGTGWWERIGPDGGPQSRQFGPWPLDLPGARG